MAPPTASAASRRSRPSQASTAGIRWDKMLRWALVVCAAIIAVMYVSSLAGIVSASAERGDRAADVARLQHEHDSLVAKQRALQGASGVEVEARRLGMVKPGEVPVVVTGLPGDSER